jgi:TPR repeat protein
MHGMHTASNNIPESQTKTSIGQLALALQYLHGDGVPQSDTMAASWFQKSAEQGNPEAMRHLASLYFSGIGLPQSHERAYIWIINAYETGDPVAAAILAEFFCSGFIVEKDFLMGLEMYQDAAAKGHKPSQNILKKLEPKKKRKVPSYGALMDVNLAIANGDVLGHFKKQALAQTMSKKQFAAANAASMAKILTPWNFMH